MIPSVAKSTMGMDTWRILFSFCFDTFKIQHQRYAMNIHESASLIPRLAARASKGSSGDLWQLCYWKPLSVETTGFQQGPSSYSSSQISIQRNHVWVYQYTILHIYIYLGSRNPLKIKCLERNLGSYRILKKTSGSAPKPRVCFLEPVLNPYFAILNPYFTRTNPF